MLMVVGIEPVDIFTIIVLVAMFGEAYFRQRLNRKADILVKDSKSLGRTLEIPRNIQVELMDASRPSNEWSPGLGAYLSARPMLIFFVIVIGLAGALGTIGFAATAPRVTLALLAVVLILAFHSGPDQYTLSEHFIQMTVKAGIDSLSDRELGLLSHVKSQFQSWTILEALFALGLLVGVLMPIDLAAIYILPFILSIFFVVGGAYQIQKGIFASPGSL